MHKSGFTVIELLIAIGISALLAEMTSSIGIRAFRTSLEQNALQQQEALSVHSESLLLYGACADACDTDWRTY